MRIFLYERAIMILSGELPEASSESRSGFDKPDALKYLCDFTGEDFGYDAQKWKNWFFDNIKTHEDFEALYDAHLELKRSREKER